MGVHIFSVKPKQGVYIFGDTQSERKAKGHFIVDGAVLADTLQCCHCNAHFVSLRGSGVQRGWCMRCNQTTCGKKHCDECVPFEKKCDELEAGKRISL